MAEKSRSFLYASICSLVCGVIIIGLAFWNANEVEWSPLTNAIAAIGGILVGISFMGILNSQGCTFCCHIGLYLYLWIMGLMTLAGIAFVVTAGIKKSEWVEDLAKKYSDDKSDENIDHLKEKYDMFMPFVIAFGIVTVFSCLVGFLAGWRYLRNIKRLKQVQHKVISDRIDRRTQAERDRVKKRHHDTVVQMTEKYKSRKQNDGQLLPK